MGTVSNDGKPRNAAGWTQGVWPWNPIGIVTTENRLVQPSGVIQDTFMNFRGEEPWPDPTSISEASTYAQTSVSSKEPRSCSNTRINEAQCENCGTAVNTPTCETCGIHLCQPCIFSGSTCFCPIGPPPNNSHTPVAQGLRRHARKVPRCRYCRSFIDPAVYEPWYCIYCRGWCCHTVCLRMHRRLCPTGDGASLVNA